MLEVVRERARRGDAAARRWLDDTTAAAVPPVLSAIAASEFDPDDPSTWGTVEIRNFIVIASLLPGFSVAGVGMDHNGHIAEMTISYDMKYLDGRLQYHYGPNTTYHANLNGPWGFTRATNIVEVVPPAECGNRLEAVGDGKGYWVLLPLPSKIGPFTVPNLKWGETSRVRNSSFAQLACPEPPPDTDSGDSGGSGDGGGDVGGGSGGGYWLTVTECDGYDYYEDGIYLFSTIESCTSYAVWVDAT